MWFSFFSALMAVGLMVAVADLSISGESPFPAVSKSRLLLVSPSYQEPLPHMGFVIDFSLIPVAPRIARPTGAILPDLAIKSLEAGHEYF
jgi:hypothetical protein